jgi:hypothetical protein
MNLPMKSAIEQRGLMKISASAHKIGNRAIHVLGPARLFTAAICAVGASIGPAVVARAQPQREPSSVACINPYSGASWTIRIDYEQRTVDSNPAQIDAATISWRDSANGWYYVLDRKSGKLTVTVASATGGNFLHDQCKLDH